MVIDFFGVKAGGGRRRTRGRGVGRFLAGVLAVFVLAVSFTGCSRVKAAVKAITGSEDTAAGSAPVRREEAVPVFAVNTTTAARGQINNYIALSGDIVAGSSVDAYSDIGGKVTALYVRIGDRVAKGGPIAEIDPSRPGMTYRRGVATAPVAGTITSLPAQLGATVSQAAPVARITAGGALEVELFVAERYISKMQVNLPCEIALDAWPGETFRGSIKELSPVVDAASRTMEIHVNVENSEDKLKAGMFAKVKIITEQKENIVKIPATALLSRFGEDYVFVVIADPASPTNRIVRKVTVIPGLLVDGVLEIQDGLIPNDEIVTRGQSLLSDGARVNVVERVAQTEEAR